MLVALGMTGIGYAAWTDQVHIEGTVTTGQWETGGCVSFWQAWRTHYAEDEMVDWLTDINSASKWLGPTTLRELDRMFALASRSDATPRDRFLGHYMATYLNIVSGRLQVASTHDISGIDGYQYLGLPSPPLPSLSQIVIAIEHKFPQRHDEPIALSCSGPTSGEFEVLRSICDAINNMETIDDRF